MVTHSDVQGWACGLDEVLDRIGPRFGRAEPCRRAAAYLQGLLASVERKNGWQLAEAVGDRTPDGMQDFLARARWDADMVRDDLRSYVVERLGDPGAVPVLDETGFVKMGTKSAGVQRQYTGTAGRIENSQVGVFLGYAGCHGRALIDRALHLPETWAEDGARRAEAHVPEGVAFATKPKLGLAMLERVRGAGVPFAWITADGVYGSASPIRRWAERHKRGYVLAVTSGQRLGFKPVTAWIEGLPEAAWQRLGAGDGAPLDRPSPIQPLRGRIASRWPRLYDWARVPYRGGAEDFACALLVRRSIAEPGETTFYLSHPRARRDHLARAGAGGGGALEHREPVRAGQGRSGAGPIRGALLGRVAPSHHARDVRAGPPRRRPQGRRRGVWTRRTWRPTCCPSRCPRSGACWPPSPAYGHPGPKRCCIGPRGADGTSNAHGARTGTDGHGDIQAKPGCSTNPPLAPWAHDAA